MKNFFISQSFLLVFCFLCILFLEGVVSACPSGYSYVSTIAFSGTNCPSSYPSCSAGYTYTCGNVLGCDSGCCHCSPPSNWFGELCKKNTACCTTACGGTYPNCLGNTTYYRDADGDGYGLLTLTTAACSAPAGYVSNSTDCDDSDITIKPTATEICDGKDNDCDGLTDEGSVCAVCYDETPSTIINHANKDWNINSNTEIAGKHINVKTFKISSGVKVTIKPFDGTKCGMIDINAQNIIIDGNLDASGAGYGGGGGGGGGSKEAINNDCLGGAGGSGIAGGNDGNSGGGAQSGVFTGECAYSNCVGGIGGTGGSGGGLFGGAGGTGGSSLTTSGNGNDRPGNAGLSGLSGKYCNGITSTCDTTTNDEVNMGSGGGGGGGGSGSGGYQNEYGPGSGGGAGNSGGGKIKLFASNSILLRGSLFSKGKVSSSGDGLNGDSFTYSGSSYYCRVGSAGGSANTSGSSLGGYQKYFSNNVYQTGSGGAGAGGGILINGSIVTVSGTIDNRGGGNFTNTGGTVKIFSCSDPTITGNITSGRTYTNNSCVTGGIPTGCYSKTDSIFPFSSILGLTTQGLVSYYPFDTNAGDYKSANNGTIVGSALITAGKFTNSYSFNGHSQYIEVANNSSLNFGTGQFSYCLWFKQPSYTMGHSNTLISKMYYNLLETGFELQIDSDGNMLSHVKNSANLFSIKTSDIKVNRKNPTDWNDWTHVCYVRGDTNEQIFINGELRASKTTGLGIDVTSTSKLLVGSKPGALGIGTIQDFEGNIDDIEIFNKAISVCDVQKLAKGQNGCLQDCPSQNTCVGNIDGNAMIYPNDDVNLTQSDLNTNILVDSNTSRKCEWYCKSGYVRGTGADENKCLYFPPIYYCQGTMDSNATLCADDNSSLTSATNISLVEYCSAPQGSIPKCESICNTGYHKQGNACVPLPPAATYFCGGIFPDNSTPCADANSGTNHDLNWGLISSSTYCSALEKCRVYCNQNFHLQSNACVVDSGYTVCAGTPPIQVKGITKGLGAYLTATPPARTSWEYYADTNSQTYCAWKCDAGYKQVGDNCVKVSINNSITELKGDFDGNINLNISCLNDVNSTAILEFYSKNYSKSVTDVNCFSSENTLSFFDSTLPLNDTIQISLTIPQPCDTCTRTIYVSTFKKSGQLSIPDNSLFGVIILLTLVIFLFKKRLK